MKPTMKALSSPVVTAVATGQLCQIEAMSTGLLTAVETQTAAHPHGATLDAIQLMLRDLHTRHDEIRHRAAFRGCTKELLEVQQELVDYLLAKQRQLHGVEGPCPDDTVRNYNSFL
jgi:hypothetical protein